MQRREGVKLVRWHLFYRRCRQGAPLFKGVLLIAAGFLVVSLAASGLLQSRLPPVAVPVLAGGGGMPGQGLLEKILESYKVDLVHMFAQGLPLSWRWRSDAGTKTAGNNPVFPWLKRGPGKLRLVLEPLGLVQSELAWFELRSRGTNWPKEPADPEGDPPASAELTPLPVTTPVKEPSPVPPLKAEGPPRVAIYHSHTSEDYVLTAGSSHTYNKEAGIVAVGRELAKVLEDKYGIPCLHDTTVHDAPVYREAYLRSGDTVAKLIKEHAELEVVLDIHRDASTKNNVEFRGMTTTKIDGKEVGRIYLIVGTDRLGLVHPKWQENHAFAIELQRQLETLYPGLSRGIKIDTARFNQQLHNRLILVEIGGDQNTLEEAKLAAGYLADALAAWFRNQTGS